MRESSGFFPQKSKLLWNLRRCWIYGSFMRGRRSAGRRCWGCESSGRLGNESTNCPHLLEGDRQTRGTRQMRLRSLSQRMSGAAAIAGMAEAALRLFHLRSHGVQIIGSRDHREQQNQRASKNTNEAERTASRGRSSPLPPQQNAGHQQRKPAEIKKKLHAKCLGRQETPSPV
jgi:hypothetical protein